jgi:hypothetical protein
MKCATPKNIYLFTGATLALVAIYIGLTMYKNTYEGLGNSADSSNVEIVAKTTEINGQTEVILESLKSDPTSYINLLLSYKNKKIATNIQTTLSTKNADAFKTLTEYDEAIDYLKTLGVSDVVIPNPDIQVTVDANNTITNAILSGLTADNQAYIDLLTSYKHKAMAKYILDASTAVPTFSIPEYDDLIEYLRTLGGIVVNNEPHMSTTRNISLSNS